MPPSEVPPREVPAPGAATVGARTDITAARVGIIMGSQSDWATMSHASDTLAALPLEERRAVPGLHPDRAPTIVAGMILLAEVMETFGLDRFEASERDILWGAALAITP